MASERPLILVTNDDGISAKGIATLIDVAKQFGEVLVIAPDKPQSGMGHAITVNKPLTLKEVDLYEGVKAYSCSGTPVDCIKFAIYKVLNGRPDMIISGINHGSNCSINVIYSGTMSAAIEGALEGVPSIGFSLLDHDKDADFTCAKQVAERVLGEALQQKMPAGVCLNVNVPKIKPEALKGIKVCRQGHAHWEDDFDTRLDPHGNEYHWMVGQFTTSDAGEDTDMWALENNYASVVPTQFDLTAYKSITAINDWEL